MQPRYRSVVCTETWPRRNWICSSSPPARWHRCAQVRRRSWGARFRIPARRAAAFTTCHIAFGVIPSPQIAPCLFTRRNTFPAVISAVAAHSSIALFTHAGIGTVRMCLPFPTKSAIIQCSSLSCRSSIRMTAVSARRSPQPRSTARIAWSRFPRSLSEREPWRSALPCSTVSQFPIRTPNRFAPLTLAMPAASSGLSSPVSAAS